jgi:hypothetical protein
LGEYKGDAWEPPDSACSRATLSQRERLVRATAIVTGARGYSSLTAAARRRDIGAFTAFLDPGAFGATTPRHPPRVVTNAISGGAWAVIQHEIADGHRAALPHLAPELAGFCSARSGSEQGRALPNFDRKKIGGRAKSRGPPVAYPLSERSFGDAGQDVPIQICPIATLVG